MRLKMALAAGDIIQWTFSPILTISFSTKLCFFEIFWFSKPPGRKRSRLKGLDELPVRLAVGTREEGLRRPRPEDGEPELGLVEELLQVGGHVEGRRLEVLGDEALQRRRVGGEDGERKDPPGAGNQAGGKGLQARCQFLISPSALHTLQTEYVLGFKW